jgi:hypothetical protein
MGRYTVHNGLSHQIEVSLVESWDGDDHVEIEIMDCESKETGFIRLNMQDFQMFRTMCDQVASDMNVAFWKKQDAQAQVGQAQAIGPMPGNLGAALRRGP